MERINLKIEGFKCYKNSFEFNFNNITLLTGANSAGKSSVVQSLLLLKKMSEEKLSEKELPEVDLNDRDCALNLGTFYDIINHDSQIDGFFADATNSITFSVNGKSVYIKDINNKSNAKKIRVETSIEVSTYINSIFGRNAVYLNAERMAPRYDYETTDNVTYCDCHGKNAGDVIQYYENCDCEKCRSYDLSADNKWKIELDKWISYIFPGTAIQVSPINKDSYQVKARGNAATNVGFGITYALPILVSGLTVPEGGMLIVENPEAHLHAKAQSNMGYFLARMAAAGVRVIIETHSEHIVNGIRRMIVEGKTVMSHEDMTIYFFQNKKGEKGILEISMDNKGNLSAFPEDFFDQVRQDTLSILRIDRAKKAQRNEER